MIDNVEKNSRDILRVLQADFPVIERPFLQVGTRLGMSEQEVIGAIRSYIDDGIIRTFGPVFDPRKLGYRSTLIAAQVDSERVAELAAMMLDIREITHNYLRDHDYNLWFTVTARTDLIMERIIKQVEKFPGVRKVLNLPMVKAFKIRAVFGAENDSPVIDGADTEEPSALLDYIDESLVRALQENFPLVDRPYLVIGDRAHMGEVEVVNTVRKWTEDGTIRRFGARLNHRNAGWTSNTLVAWGGGNIDMHGRTFSAMKEVSHCYKRTPHHEWPYELYTMVHAPSSVEMQDTLERMKALAEDSKPVFMNTLFELKKTSMKFFLEDTE